MSRTWRWCREVGGRSENWRKLLIAKTFRRAVCNRRKKLTPWNIFIASTSPTPFSGEDWLDPLGDAIRFRAFIDTLVEGEAQAALGGCERYRCDGPPKRYRGGHRQRRTM